MQVANSWGQTVDKRSFEDRRAFVQEHLELVLDSAERPFEGQRCAALCRSCVLPESTSKTGHPLWSFVILFCCKLASLPQKVSTTEVWEQKMASCS